MRVPLSWLTDYVDITLPASELAHRLTMAGTEIAGLERAGGEWEKVRVGLVVGVEPHPNADRLRLATVDLGQDERHTVVCGAPNVAVGQKIAFAPVGATLIDGHTRERAVLKAAKIRGVVSAGMVCSERELGLSDEHEGILVLPTDASVGVPLAEVLGDTILHAEVTPNRPDCLSILGVAREAAAVMGKKWRDPPVDYPEAGPSINSLTSVEVRDPDLCPRYFVTLVQGVKVGPSPGWMQERLIAAGMRPINNIVDVTNYVMLETGQPLHAFDLDRLAGRRIIVRRSRPGEPITTLYGDTYALDGEVLCVCDEAEPVTLGGILGARKAEVSDSTVNVLLEAATFAPHGIRHTVSALGQTVHTEAAIRNERGLTAEMTRVAALRCTRLFLEVCGGKAAKGQIDIYPGKQKEVRISVPAGRLARVLGVDVPATRVRSALGLLGFTVRTVSPDRYVVKPPFWRSDIHHPDDVAEEVARITGYDELPTANLSGAIPEYRPDEARRLRERVRALAAALGLQEVITYSVTTRAALVATNGESYVAAHEPLRLANPMTSEREVMRTSLRPGMLEAQAVNARQPAARLFEVGRSYLPRPDDLPEEREILVAGLSGERLDRWGRPSGEELDFYDAKGFVEALGRALGVEWVFASIQEEGLLDGQTSAVHLDKVRVGTVGEVQPSLAKRFGNERRIFVVELDVTALVGRIPAVSKYVAVPRFPPVVEDLAVVVDHTAEGGRLAQAIGRHRLVREVAPFDVFTGGSVPAGKKSITFAVTYQAEDHTLTDEEVARAREQILARLRHEHGAVLRT